MIFDKFKQVFFQDAIGFVADSGGPKFFGRNPTVNRFQAYLHNFGYLLQSKNLASHKGC